MKYFNPLITLCIPFIVQNHPSEVIVVVKAYVQFYCPTKAQRSNTFK